MYPGMIVEFDDQSEITSLRINEVRNQPLFASLFTSDKGPEDWGVYSGQEFFNSFGKNISFSRHGQPLLQTAMSINAGARILCKRLVSDDATLANAGVVATVTADQVQAVDANGNPLYVDADGNDTTDASNNTAKMVDVAKIAYSIKSAEGISANDPKEAAAAIEGALSEGEYLLWTITDNGRGVSKKRFQIVPNYRLSKNYDYLLYNFYVTESGTDLESTYFNPSSEMIVNSENISLQSMVATYSNQLRCVQSETGTNAFFAKLSEITGLDTTELLTIDALFGCDKKGNALTNIIVDTENGINLQSSFGQALLGGDNGTFGDSPIAQTDEYVTQATAALDGTYSTEIFNLDQYKIDAFIDANYPDGVKRAIETLVAFREDCVFFRDLGLGLTNLELIIDKNLYLPKSMFFSTYMTSYDVIDPYSKKQISVTVGYSLAQILVQHFNNGRILPPAGIKHNMIIIDAIDGTINFAPVICPTVNQKEMLEEERINWAAYIDNDLVIESLYTSQEKYTQFSFVNNVLGIQEVVKRIRTRCPAIRYSFIDGSDLEKYKAEVEEVIAPFQPNFKTLSLEYVADPTYTANKIFYAVLNVCFRDFIQTEWFKVTAINSTAATS